MRNNICHYEAVWAPGGLNNRNSGWESPITNVFCQNSSSYINSGDHLLNYDINLLFTTIPCENDLFRCKYWQSCDLKIDLYNQEL